MVWLSWSVHNLGADFQSFKAKVTKKRRKDAQSFKAKVINLLGSFVLWCTAGNDIVHIKPSFSLYLGGSLQVV